MVDAYIKVEWAKLDRICHNQEYLRVEQYCGLIDHLNKQAAELNVHLGKMVIVPLTFQCMLYINCHCLHHYFHPVSVSSLCDLG